VRSIELARPRRCESGDPTSQPTRSTVSLPVSWRARRREPLVSFLALGAVVQLAWRLLASRPAATITITEDARRAAIQAETERWGRDLTDRNRTRAMERRIDDEDLLRPLVAAVGLTPTAPSD
jgi:hypothetical protein